MSQIGCKRMDRSGPEGRGLVSSIKALFVTSEVAGLTKAEKLGEVSAGLPLALRQRGIGIRILMPAYQQVIAKLPDTAWFGALPGRAGVPPCPPGQGSACRRHDPVSGRGAITVQSPRNPLLHAEGHRLAGQPSAFRAPGADGGICRIVSIPTN
jgi:hypothetical protein